MLKLEEPFRNQEIFKISSFNSSEKKKISQFLVDIFPLGSRAVDPHIFADPDPGSQNMLRIPGKLFSLIKIQKNFTKKKRKYYLLFVRRDRKSLATYIVQGLILFVQADPANYQKPRNKYSKTEKYILSWEFLYQTLGKK